MLRKIWKKIEEAPVITIFRHTSPDMDAIGTQMGLKKALQSIFPDKKVLALGEQSRGNFVLDTADDKTIEDSLAILLDTANAARIDDDRYLKAENSVRLDHHVKVEDLAKIDYVDDKASATAQVAAQLLETNGQTIPKEAAQLLYEALTADNIRFTTGNTTPESLKAGAWLIGQGADVVKAELENNGIGLDDFRYETYIRQKACQKEKFLFSLMSQEDYTGMGFTCARAKEKVAVLGGIRDVEIWALFTQIDETGLWNASLRSRTIDIRDIAAAWGGGGHACACGIKNLDICQIQQLIEALAQRSTQKKQD